MRCEEVMEYMQRHLDRDLNEEESKRMMMHSKTCPDCSDMLERLELLNRDLESLPKLAPPFSIVDSIMPKLLEIDAAGTAGENQAAAVESEAASQVLPMKRKRFIPLPASWKAAGVVAAGLLLGIMIFNGLPKTYQQIADQSGNSASSAAELSAPETAVADSASTLSVEDTHRPEASVVTKKGSAPVEDAETAGIAAAPAVEEPAPAAEQQPVAEDANDDRNEVMLKEVEPSEQVAEANQGKQGKSFGIASIESSPDAPTEGGGVPAAEPVEPAEPQHFFMAGGEEVAPAGLSTEDGNYLAFVELREDGSSGVKITDREGAVVFESQQAWSSDAEIRLEEWSNYSLRYSVRAADDLRSFTIDAEARTETEIRP